MALKKVQRTSVSDQAYDILVKKITSGEFSSHLIFEEIDFAMSIDGRIRFLK